MKLTKYAAAIPLEIDVLTDINTRPKNTSNKLSTDPTRLIGCSSTLRDVISSRVWLGDGVIR